VLERENSPDKPFALSGQAKQLKVFRAGFLFLITQILFLTVLKHSFGIFAGGEHCVNGKCVQLVLNS